MAGLNGGESPNLIYNANEGKYCNTHDDLAYMSIYGTPCLGGESVMINGSDPVSLTPPPKSKKAQMVLEADLDSAQNKIVARFRICGNNPTPNDGFPLGDMATICIGNPVNLQNFKIIGLNESDTHKLSVIYF